MSNLPEMDEPTWRTMLEYLDGTLPDDQVERFNEQLRQNRELRAAFAELLVQEIKLREIEQEAAAARSNDPDLMVLEDPSLDFEPCPLPSGLPESLPLHGPSRWRRNLALAAAVSLLGVLLVFLGWNRGIARLTELEGTVVIERGHGKFAAQQGDLLKSGDVVITTVASRAHVAYLNEATTVELNDSTRVGLEMRETAKHLVLAQGGILAEVAPQQPGAPMTLATPETVARVVGTRFRLSSDGNTTRLAVLEGTVSVPAGQDEPEIRVETGNALLVEPGRPSRLVKLSSERGSLLLEQLAVDGSVAESTYLDQAALSGVGVAPGGSRVRGYLHPPRSGAYTLRLQSNTRAELRLDTPASPGSERPLLTLDPAVSAQTNRVMELRSGEARFLEITIAPGTREPALTLSWIMPDGRERVVYGDYLSPFDPTE